MTQKGLLTCCYERFKSSAKEHEVGKGKEKSKENSQL